MTALHGSFLREVSILLQLRAKRLNKKYRLPALHSLVYYSDKPNCILGMLIDRIDDGETLANWINGGRNHARSLKDNWDNQLGGIVRVLHRHDIIWGDVKPDNVVIDRDPNLWVIDFGGGYNGPYVNKNVVETIEGDLQGLSRMSVEFLEGKKPRP
jgi:tRNA A-37 threonylcarbamoyl transferase component Bud32